MIPPREDQFPQSNKLDYINQLLRPFITDQEERKQCLRLIKDEVFNNLSTSDIEEHYSEFLVQLSGLLNSVTNSKVS